MSKLVPDLFRALALLAAAALCAGLGNGLARPQRQLAWTGWAPAPADLPAANPPPPPAAPAPAPVPPVPRPAEAAAAPKPAAQFAPSPQEVVRDISSAAAWEAFRLRIPFLDARRSEEYAAGHVPGAWSIPIWEADAPARITEFEARADPQPLAPIAVYCSGGDCADSRLLAKRLVDLGYRNLLIYRDGFPDWVRQGRPQEVGARP
jgi:rhodanese-related sulfurtransferase